MHWKTEWREYKSHWRQSLIGSNLILSYLPKHTGKSCFKSLKNFVDWNEYIFFSSIWAVPLFLSTARAQFFPIRTSRPANNIDIFFSQRARQRILQSDWTIQRPSYSVWWSLDNQRNQCGLSSAWFFWCNPSSLLRCIRSGVWSNLDG